MTAEPDTYQHAYAQAKRRAHTRLLLLSDALCLIGGVGLALGVWLLAQTAAGALVIAAGVALGVVGLILAGLAGAHAARAAHTQFTIRKPDGEVRQPETFQ